MVQVGGKTTVQTVLLVTLLITAMIAAITIGGKAIGKSFAINRSKYSKRIKEQLDDLFDMQDNVEAQVQILTENS